MNLKFGLSLVLLAAIWVSCDGVTGKSEEPTRAKGDAGSNGLPILLNVSASSVNHLQTAERYPLVSYEKKLLGVMLLYDDNTANDPNDDQWTYYPVPEDAPVTLNLANPELSEIFSVEVEVGTVVAIAFVLDEVTTFQRQGDGCSELEVSQTETTFLLLSTNANTSIGTSVAERYVNGISGPAKLWSVKSGMSVVASLVGTTSLVTDEFPINYVDKGQPINLTLGFLSISEGTPDNCLSSPPELELTLGVVVNNEVDGGGDFGPAISKLKNDRDLSSTTSDNFAEKDVEYATTCKDQQLRKITLTDPVDRKLTYSIEKYSDPSCENQIQWSVDLDIDYTLQQPDASLQGQDMFMGQFVKLLTTTNEINITAHTEDAVTYLNSILAGGSANHTLDTAMLVSSLSSSHGPAVGGPIRLLMGENLQDAKAIYFSLDGKRIDIFYAGLNNPNRINRDTHHHPDVYPANLQMTD